MLRLYKNAQFPFSRLIGFFFFIKQIRRSDLGVRLRYAVVDPQEERYINKNVTYVGMKDEIRIKFFLLEI